MGAVCSIVILGGSIVIFTPTEAASIAVVVVVLVGFQQGTLRLGDIPRMLESSARVCGVIVPIIAIAHPLAQMLASLSIPQTMVGSITNVTDSPVLIILMMIGVLVLAGCVMEATPNIVILAPLIATGADGRNGSVPFCDSYGDNASARVHYPAIRLNLFVVAGLTRCSVLAIARYAIPFVLAMLSVALLVAFVPWLSLWWQ